MNEGQIIKQCKSGKKEAFEFLVKKYAPTLHGVALRYVQNQVDAQDVVQNSFIQIFQHIQHYKSTGSFEAWLKKITVNCALKYLRSRKDWLVTVEAIHDNYHFEEPMVLQELAEADILKLMNQMQDEHKIIFNLCIIDGYSHKEIAEKLNISESYSRVKLTRARKELAEIMTKSINNGFERTRKID